MKRDMYGVDIAVRRADDLDKKMIAYVAESSKSFTSSVLDIGCGAGGQSVRLVETGASVLGVDINDYTDEFNILVNDGNLNEQQLLFIQGDMVHLDELLEEREFDVCCFQRTSHYMPYTSAVATLKWLRMHVREKLFISVTGLESDIGLSYSDKDKVLDERFFTLCDEDSEKFNINQSVCLYTPEEFITVLQEAGWEIEECWVSAFGNIKAVYI